MRGADLERVVGSAHVIVCVGSGGVGKTTCSSVLAMHGAMQGRRVLVMTVDPARRLANALGLDRFDEHIQRIDLSAVGYEGPGELHATMLDMKRTMDDIVERFAPEASHKKILENRFYEAFSTGLAGAQELSASERLYQEASTGNWDLIVLDTPPTTNALDFLDAPLRFHEALDSSAMSWVMEAGGVAARKGGGLLNLGSQMFGKVIGRFTGTEFFEELARFLMEFSVLFDGFRERTRQTAALFSDDATRFVIVTSPDPMTVVEALYFRQRLKELNVAMGALIVNRVRSRLLEGDQFDRASVASELMTLEGAELAGRPLVEQLAGKLVRNAVEWNVLAARDRRVCADLIAEVQPAPVVQMPLYDSEVHSLSGLDTMRRSLFDPERSTADRTV